MASLSLIRPSRTILLSFSVTSRDSTPPCASCYVNNKSELRASKREMAMIKIFRSRTNLSAKYISLTVHRKKRKEETRQIFFNVREMFVPRLKIKKRKFSEMNSQKYRKNLKNGISRKKRIRVCSFS